MNSDRKTATALGILIISGMVFGILSSVPVIERSDYLLEVSSIKRQVLMAVFFQSAMAIVYVCVAVLLYQIIVRYNEGIALACFGFKIIGAAFLFLGMISLLLLLFLSKSFVAAGQPDPSHSQIIGELLRAGRDWINHIGMILPWSIGGIIVYFCFIRMKLTPEWLSVWGLLGSIFTLASTFLLMFDVIKIVTPIYLIMNTPTALLELVLAVFLIIKGFNPIIVETNNK
jgi:hypothetical protein